MLPNRNQSSKLAKQPSKSSKLATQLLINALRGTNLAAILSSFLSGTTTRAGALELARYCEETIAISNHWQAFVNTCVSMRSSDALFANLPKKQPVGRREGRAVAKSKRQAERECTRGAIRSPCTMKIGQ